MQTRILLVEDEPQLAEAIQLSFGLEQMEVVIANTGPEAVKCFRAQRFNLVVLDIMLPGMDGFQVCQAIRAIDGRTPILFLSVRGSSADRIAGLKLGADDYLTKPFQLEELLLRIRALLRRSQEASVPVVDTFHFGGNEIDFRALMARTYKGQWIRLSAREAALLRLLINRSNEAVSRKEILEIVWGYDVLPMTRTIDNFILMFRKYFEPDPQKPRYFLSVRGVGYKFRPDTAEAVR